MADPIRVSGPISGTDRTLSFETGKFAPKAKAQLLRLSEKLVFSPQRMPHACPPRRRFLPVDGRR